MKGGYLEAIDDRALPPPLVAVPNIIIVAAAVVTLCDAAVETAFVSVIAVEPPLPLVPLRGMLPICITEVLKISEGGVRGRGRSNGSGPEGEIRRLSRFY
jgi:hypothetical protein